MALTIASKSVPRVKKRRARFYVILQQIFSAPKGLKFTSPINFSNYLIGIPSELAYFAGL